MSWSGASGAPTGLQDTVLADDLGTFVWDVHADRWDWSPQMHAVHGYRVGEVEPTFDLVVGHKVGEGRRRAEQIMGRADTADFRFRNLHDIVDARGRRRRVLTLGAADVLPEPDGSRRQTVRGFVLEVGRGPGPTDQTWDAGLSERERDVLALVATGRSNTEIATELFLSINTVKTYLRTAYRKIGVSRRPDAILWVLGQQE